MEGSNQKVRSEEINNYRNNNPESTILYKTIQKNLETYFYKLEQLDNKGLPYYIKNEFYNFLKCGILAHRLFRHKCEECRFEQLIAFSCKKRGFCPSCAGKRMNQTAALLVDHVFPKVATRQWVLSFP